MFVKIDEKNTLKKNIFLEHIRKYAAGKLLAGLFSLQMLSLSALSFYHQTIKNITY